MSLIPGIAWEALKTMTEAEVKKLACSEILDSTGAYMATLIVPQTDYIRVQTEYLGQTSNSVMPKVEATSPVTVTLNDGMGTETKLVAAPPTIKHRKKRKAKKAAKK